ncbi:DNA translocase FtsK [Rhizobium sp. 0TCS1.26]|uniref:DNA translocase FtsK n=1 Tax=Rhizobium sp. 0TCS1.26 TaxID=3142623 RepID=UPI003D26FD30
MQFPRTNFNQASQNGQSEDGPEPVATHGQETLPQSVDPNAAVIQHAPWQAAFKLAPNVRFTRTPETALARPRGRDPVGPVAPEERVPAATGRLVEPVDVDPSGVPQTETLAPELLVTALNGVASAMQQPIPANLPQMPKVKPEPSPRALIFKRTRPEADPKPQEAVPAAAPVALTLPEPTVAVAPVTTPAPAKLWLSDFAFFEAGIEMEAPAQAAALQPVVATLPIAMPPVPYVGRAAEIVRQSLPIEPNTVTALYREVRPGATPRPAMQVAAQPLVQSVVHPGATPVSQAASPVLPVQTPPQAAAVEPQPVEPVAPAAETPAPLVSIHAAPAERTIPMTIRRPQPGLLGLGGGLTPRKSDDSYEFPPISLLQQPFGQQAEAVQPDALQQSAGLLESILEDFGVKGEIIDVRPGPVVTLYEFEPAPGVKSSRVIGLADDIARSMSALSARVAVVPGRNVIGIELPNAVREVVFFRELIECEDYWETKHRLPLCLGKTIGGEPVIAELAKMPHLLVAGTTGSGKSVAINTMILSLLYRLRPEECRLIMIDPKMLELSVYDGIPHLLTPVVTDPKKAVLALKWAVREMEDRYRKMSRLGVRNIDGYNARAAQAREKGETITVSVQTGFDRNSGEIVYEDQELDLSPMPYIVVVVDEMADLMMVAGKEIEGAIQRLAQMARAAGIHLIMATQRPSVDVITGTIKANFPTRISFQVTSKIDSRTILGEMGAEQLLGQGDMLHMAGGGRISRVHGPFVSDAEVEHVVTHLKAQGRPDYLGNVTEDESEMDDEPDADAAVFDRTGMGAEDGDDLYDKAVKVVMKDRKCSTSYIQRRLSIGYNRAASLVERMEQEGLVGPANHVGKREIISGKPSGSSED